ncbi:copper resistance protein NlpE [Halpernia sp.]|uniref:copper resistance protein NlpE n=1 Tax=Halpernia sp. TaxID=2782209 RepID=UPI003A8FBBE8
MKNLLKLSLLIVVLSAISCAQKKENREEFKNEHKVEEKRVDGTAPVVVAGEGNRLSIEKLEGNYKGLLPCADCPGIETELKLKKDGTYKLESEYKERSTKIEEEGTFSVSPDGHVILKSNKTGEQETVYFVQNGTIYMVSSASDVEVRPNYKLEKQ